MTLFSDAELQEMVDGGYVSIQKHPDADLWIHNYTPRAQYKRMWNETTLQCRGLILGAEGEPIARPFRKFFNLGEHEGEIPADPFDVYEKMDGSLGILYWLDGKPQIATRGSFTSEQAQWASKEFIRRHGLKAGNLSAEFTYLFEIIAPWNRIVVDYGDREDLVLLAAINTASGREMLHEQLRGYEALGFSVVPCFGAETDPAILAQRERPNAEGFVIHWPTNGLRLKVKFSEYLRLHRLLTGVTPRYIWEQLRDGNDLTAMLDKVPDEFADWVNAQSDLLVKEYGGIEQAARDAFTDTGDRKQNAEIYKRFKYPQILFAMLDRKSYDAMIWKILYPPPSRAFKAQEEEAE